MREKMSKGEIAEVYDALPPVTMPDNAIPVMTPEGFILPRGMSYSDVRQFKRLKREESTLVRALRIAANYGVVNNSPLSGVYDALEAITQQRTNHAVACLSWILQERQIDASIWRDVVTLVHIAH